MATGREMDVRGIAGQEHPAAAVTIGLPGGIAVVGDPPRAVHTEIGAGEFE